MTRRRWWVVAGTILALLLLLLAAFVGPLALPDGKFIFLPYVQRFSEPVVVMVDQFGPASVHATALPPGEHAVRVVGMRFGRPAEGDAYYFVPVRPADATTPTPVLIARETLWTRFMLRGRSSDRSAFFDTVAEPGFSGSGPITDGTCVVKVSHLGVLDSVSATPSP